MWKKDWKWSNSSWTGSKSHRTDVITLTAWTKLSQTVKGAKTGQCVLKCLCVISQHIHHNSQHQHNHNHWDLGISNEREMLEPHKWGYFGCFSLVPHCSNTLTTSTTNIYLIHLQKKKEKKETDEKKEREEESG